MVVSEARGGGSRQNNIRRNENDDNDDNNDVVNNDGRLKMLHEGSYSVEYRRLNKVRGGAEESSPIRAVTDFTELGLNENLYRAICRMGFAKPSRIQETALPLLLDEPPVNMMAQAQSGTGKTAAFLLAALARVRPQDNWPQVMVILPTLELAKQIASECSRMLVHSPDVRIRHAVRGQCLIRHQTITEHILIGTPGKLLDWALRLQLFDMKKVRVFVLDEADVMLDECGHGDAVIKLHCQLDLAACQMLLFSATFSDEVVQLANVIINPPLVRLTLRRDQLALGNIHHFRMETRTERDKLEAISNLYESLSIGQCIVFCRTRADANRVSALMRDLGQNVAQLHGELDPEQRLATIEGFRHGQQKVMVTTNVCARGIDIIQVSLVINFDLPLARDMSIDLETYYHRVGRAGRFGRPGTAVNLVNPDRTYETRALDQVAHELQINIQLVDFRNHEQIVELMQFTEADQAEK